MNINLNLNPPAYTPELPKEILLTIIPLAERDDLSRLAPVCRLFYNHVLDIERQEAKKSLQQLIASTRICIAGEISKAATEQKSLDDLQQKLDSAFKSAHFTCRSDVVKKRHELQQEICQIVTKQFSIGKIFRDSLSCQVNRIATVEEIRSPDYDIARTFANRRIVQVLLYANACTNLQSARDRKTFESAALLELTRSHRLNEALALFKGMNQRNLNGFFLTMRNEVAVMLLVQLLNNAKRSSDVEFVYNSLNDKARAEVAATGNTMFYEGKLLPFEALVWKTADETPDPYLMRLIGELF